MRYRLDELPAGLLQFRDTKYLQEVFVSDVHAPDRPGTTGREKVPLDTLLLEACQISLPRPVPPI